MPESTLSISYTDLQSEVGEFLHYGQDVSTWSAEQTKRVDRYIQAGLRQFYFPPAIEGVEPGYQWTFMQPTSELLTVQGQSAYDMPDDFSALLGELHYEQDEFWHSITHIAEGRMLDLREYDDDEDYPRHFTTRFKASDGSTGQRHELLLWPTPEREFRLTFRYEAYAGKIDAINSPYPLGGMKYGECITESCLSVAEKRGNDEQGFHEEQFQLLLIAAVAHDRRNTARRYGHMGGCEDLAQDGVMKYQTSYRVTYKGQTW